MDISRRLLQLITFKSHIQITVAKYEERRKLAMILEGKRAVFKDTAEMCTILKAEVFEEGIRYTVHFDKHPESIKQVVWDALAIIGEVQF